MICPNYTGTMFTHFRWETPKWSTFAHREDPDEMSHNATFHQGLHCLLRQNLS